MNIHDIYIEVKDQAQADRLKDICLKYGLPIWESKRAFEFNVKSRLNQDFEYNITDEFGKGEFFIVYRHLKNKKTKITEQKFIKLLEDGNI